MADLSLIQTRLESLSELSELVGALRSMAAARAREAEDASEGTKHYCAIVERAIREAPPARGPAGAAQGDAATLLVITSENGFVGGFNSRLIETALEHREPGEALVVVGRRGQITAAELDTQADAYFTMSSRRDGVTPLSRRIASRLARCGSARIVSARPARGAGFDISIRRILPVDLPRALGVARLDAPLHHLPEAELLAGLSAEYLFAEIADALMESLASENIARLRTMDAAARNIDERLETLTRQERVARQEQTTSDMLDVVTGAEAVNHG